MWDTMAYLDRVDARAQHISLREISDGNRSEIEALSVTAEQSEYVASVTESFQDAAETPGACPKYWGLYLDEQPVGFVMISDNIPLERTEYLGPYYLWRLLIDSRWQGQGLGTAAIDLVVDYVKQRPDAHTLFTSHVPGPASPLGFYLKYGFVLTGDVFDDEPVLALPVPAVGD
jgi:diamine N-acetyltransferase